MLSFQLGTTSPVTKDNKSNQINIITAFICLCGKPYLVLVRYSILPLQVIAQIERNRVPKLRRRGVSFTRDRALASKRRQVVLPISESKMAVEYVLCGDVPGVQQ